MTNTAEVRASAERLLAIDAALSPLADGTTAFNRSDVARVAEAVRLRDEQIAALRDLVSRFRQWDDLPGRGDGPYWMREADKVLAVLSHAEGCAAPVCHTSSDASRDSQTAHNAAGEGTL